MCSLNVIICSPDFIFLIDVSRSFFIICSICPFLQICLLVIRVSVILLQDKSCLLHYIFFKPVIQTVPVTFLCLVHLTGRHTDVFTVNMWLDRSESGHLTWMTVNKLLFSRTSDADMRVPTSTQEITQQ